MQQVPPKPQSSQGEWVQKCWQPNDFSWAVYHIIRLPEATMGVPFMLAARQGNSWRRFDLPFRIIWTSVLLPNNNPILSSASSSYNEGLRTKSGNRLLSQSRSIVWLYVIGSAIKPVLGHTRSNAENTGSFSARVMDLCQLCVVLLRRRTD